MKRLGFFIIGLAFFFVYFLLIPQRTSIMAAVCGGICKSSAECPEDCSFCRTEQLNLESAQYIGMDCQSISTCYCFAEDFGSIHEDGSEVIVDPVKPITETGENDLKKIGLESLVEKVNKFLPIAMGLGGVIAFILIIFGGFQIILSAGNPDKVKAGQEMITSAIAGLLLIIFSVFILRLIGHDILDIPDFGRP